MERITFQITKTFGNLKANFEELNRAVTESVARYRNVVYSDDQIALAKKDLATLRAERTKIDDARKSVKKEFIKPYEDFEAEVKKTLGIYDAAINEINAQVSNAETAEKAKKKAEIEQWWKINGVKSIEGITLDKVWDPRYLNKGYTEKKWQEDLTAKVQKIENDLKTLSLMQSEMVNYMLPIYVETMDLSEASRRYEAFKENERRAEEARRQIAERQAQMAQRKPQEPTVEKHEEVTTEEKKPAETAEKRYSMTFSVEADERSMKELCDTLRALKSSGGLAFKVLEKSVSEVE